MNESNDYSPLLHDLQGESCKENSEQTCARKLADKDDRSTVTIPKNESPINRTDNQSPSPTSTNSRVSTYPPMKLRVKLRTGLSVALTSGDMPDDGSSCSSGYDYLYTDTQDPVLRRGTHLITYPENPVALVLTTVNSVGT